ncbi:MAG: hypothetical protein JXQ77_04765 [Campylobacterales bacterium]|nr:hypothetical protein [Campylobacterales bacterium]
MCLIITFIILALGISNIQEHNWLLGGVELSIGFGFLILLINNIKKARCEKHGKCNDNCSLTSWISKQFNKTDKT